MSDISLYGITSVLFCVISAIEGLRESGTLLVVPSGGTYDPNALWTTDISQLVGVNDCPDDESKTIADLALKGTYRSATVLNLTYYEDVKLSYHVYDNYEKLLLEVTNCNMPGNVAICPASGSDLITGEMATGDGFKLYENNTLLTKVAVFNPRNYLSTAPNGVKIIIADGSGQQSMATPGYEGCRQNPSSTAASVTDLTIDKCYAACTSSTYFLLTATECFCEATLPAAADESTCTTLCPGDDQQLCGSSNTATAYKTASFQSFVNFYDGLQATTELGGSQAVTDTGIKEVDLGSEKFVSAAQVVIEEECQLTNLYFDEPPTPFNVLVGPCGSSDNFHATLNSDGEKEPFDAVKTTCVKLQAEANNYTYPRASITLFGPTGDIIDVGGVFVVKGEWTIPEESSSISSSMEMSSSIDVSSSMEMSSSTDVSSSMSSSTDVPSSMSQFIPATEPTMMPSTSMDNAEGTMVISPTTGDTGTTIDPSATEPTIGATDATASPGSAASLTASPSDAASTSAPVSPTASAPASAYPSASASASASASPTTTPGTGVATTTKKPLYTKDGRLIFEACTCVCKPPPLKDDQSPLDQAKEKAKEISEELQVNTKNLSATIRKKESATDERPSASAGGYVACVLLGVVGVLFIAADVLSISTHLYMLKENVSSVFGKS